MALHKDGFSDHKLSLRVNVINTSVHQTISKFKILKKYGTLTVASVLVLLQDVSPEVLVYYLMYLEGNLDLL